MIKLDRDQSATLMGLIRELMSIADNFQKFGGKQAAKCIMLEEQIKKIIDPDAIAKKGE